MQNEYILIPWDSVHNNNTWFNEIVIEHPRYGITKDETFFDINTINIIILLLVYNIILFIFLAFRNENLLYRKNKAIKKRQL
jgi:hypothetical protein